MLTLITDVVNVVKSAFVGGAAPRRAGRRSGGYRSVEYAMPADKSAMRWTPTTGHTRRALW